MKSTSGLPGRDVLGNVVARVIALAALAAATVVVARTGGAASVGAYALLRVLPGLFGVLAACGLPSATAYFVAGTHGDRTALWRAIVALMLLGGTAGTLAWLLATPLLHQVFLSSISTAAVLLAGVSVFTQLPVAVGKGVLQGLEDLRGTNIVIGLEELSFLPIFALLYATGVRGAGLIIWSLILADIAVAGYAWARIVRQAPGVGIGRTDRALLLRISRFGLRGQVGGFIGLLNLRLDFAVLGALAGPAVLGVYAVASKYAELLRLPGLAITWVMYPRIARQGQDQVASSVRRLLPRAVGLNLLGAAGLAAIASVVLPQLYGFEFRAAVGLSWILLGGLVLQGASGLATAYLYGTGRPGLSSLALGAGLVLTLGLDIMLIPRFGALGAAVASTVAYLASDIFLIALFLQTSRSASARSLLVAAPSEQ